MRPRPTLLAMVLTLGVSSGVVACGDDTDTDPEVTGRVAGDVVVFAAASLTEAFTVIGEAFEVEHPGTSVTFSFAASSELAAQIIEGAPADVYASADVRNVTRLVDAGEAAGDPAVFARNRAVIVVAEGNPLDIEQLADIADPDLVVVLCAPAAPCGAYAKEILDKAAINANPASYEANPKAVVTKVRLGEADAGIAYVTDVIAAGADVDGVGIPDEQNVVAEYPIVVTAEAPNPRAGQAFVDFVLGETGQAALREHGFVAP